MVRKIRLDQIGDKFRKEVSTLVAATTLEATARLKLATPVDTGTLRNAWLPEIKEFEGVVENRVEYAEPVAYGTNLPPSWVDENGRPEYKTRQNTEPGYPDLIAKELVSWAQGEYQKIVRRT